MTRRVFFSFDYDDIWVVNQIRNIGTFETENQFYDHAEIEQIKRATDNQIKNWIDQQLKGASVTCVLIGEETYKSKWVKYEIEQSNLSNKGLLGIYINNLKNRDGVISYNKGNNPIPDYYHVKTYDPLLECPYSKPYECVSNNINRWIEYAAKQVGR